MYNRGTYKPPKEIVRWKEGARCTLCNTPILKSQLSEDAFEREYELKWCLHIACHKKVVGRLDRETR